jgi:hypothetical protein
LADSVSSGAALQRTSRGVFPCVGILTREEIMCELRDFSIRYEVERQGR